MINSSVLRRDQNISSALLNISLSFLEIHSFIMHATLDRTALYIGKNLWGITSNLKRFCLTFLRFFYPLCIDCTLEEEGLSRE